MKSIKHNLFTTFVITILLVGLFSMGVETGAANIQAGCLPEIIVTNTNDNGVGTLRQAILDVCEEGTITFNLDLPATITLTSGELMVNKPLTIQGPGAHLLNINGNNSSRILNTNGRSVYLDKSVVVVGKRQRGYALL